MLSSALQSRGKDVQLCKANLISLQLIGLEALLLCKHLVHGLAVGSDRGEERRGEERAAINAISASMHSV